MPSAEPTIRYYNASMFNPVTGQVVPASISDVRAASLIERPDDWECSIVRFDISAALLPPIVVPLVAPPPAAATVPTLLRVTLRSLGVDFQQPVNVFTTPDTPGFIYSIDELMTAINLAFAAAFAAMPAVVGVTSPPMLAFNPVTQLINIFYQATYVTAPVEVYLNSAAYRMIPSLPAAFFGYNNVDGKDYRLQLDANTAVTIPAVGARAGYPTIVQAVANEVRQSTQAGPSLSALNGVRSIYISTDLPIAAESLPNSVGVAQNTNTSSASQSILTDFLLSSDPGENPISDRINISYLPTAEYRMIQMLGNQPISRIRLDWYYTLYDGTIGRMNIPPGGVCSAKLMFRRASARDLFA